MTLEKVYKEVDVFRKAWGNDIVTDVKVSADGKIASYIFMKNDKDAGYKQEYDLVCNMERHCGLAKESFWTEWKEA